MNPESIDAFFNGLGRVLIIVVPVAMAVIAYRQDRQSRQLTKVTKAMTTAEPESDG